MRKFTFVLIMMLGFMGVTMAQTVENFESLKMNLFDAGNTGSISVVPNPDPSGVNTSAYVAKMVIGITGRKESAGWYATLSTPVDMTANKYMHIKVWKPRLSPTGFKFEKNGGDSGDTFPIADVTETGKWVELVYDFSAKPLVTGDYVKIVLLPDFEKPYLGTTDVTLYFDDMFVNNDPAVGSAPAKVMENFEIIPLTVMVKDPPAVDLSSVALVPNPDQTGVNFSKFALRFVRSNNGLIWSGFFSPTPIDLTTNKYVHVKVWKNRISTVKFKIEGGTGGALEVESKYPQTKVKAWEDMVFDFSAKTGIQTTIVFMPDFTDPIVITANDTMYIDDIVVNNISTPQQPITQTISVNMNGKPLGATDRLWIAGSFGNADNGTWNGPGEKPANEMLDPDKDGIYSVNLHLPDGAYEFKFIINAWGAANEDPGPGLGNKTQNISGNMSLTYIWGEAGVVVAVKEKPLAGKINMYPNPVRNELTVNSSADLRSATITSMVGKVVGRYTFNNAGTQSINTEGLKSGMYFVTFIGKDGSKVTQKLVKD